MKAFVAGLILIVLSGAALLWQRWQEAPPASASPSPADVQGNERTTRCMVWRAQRGKATVWLCGSFHALRENDYPLPGPYETAFAESKIIVTEIPQGESNNRKTQDQLLVSGNLADGKRLEDIVSEKCRMAVKAWSESSGADMSQLQPLKPWRAALVISAATAARHGYRNALGMERHFAANPGNRRTAGLTTAEHQFSLFDRIEPALQEQMILRAIAEDGEDGSRRAARAIAWREGDAAGLAALLDESMRGFGALRNLLLLDRNSEWLPVIEQYLEGTETVMVLVGAGHLAGSGSLIELLAQKGVSLRQMEYQTVRPAANR